MPGRGSPGSSAPSWLRRLATWLSLLVVVVLVSGWLLLRGSLPQLDGRADLPGLSAPVSIQRDALGVVTIDAASETDMARALGFVHAQERFFEMDLLRRRSAGELAELFGPIALEQDRQHRVHRLRARVNAHIDDYTGTHRAQLQAYTDGVNAGLQALTVRPWPYVLLRQTPRRWEMADSALVGYAMYFELQDSRNARELAMSRIKPHLPPALYALLGRDGTEWDAPLFGVPRGNAILPRADEVDLRTLPSMDGPDHVTVSESLAPGSNHWAVSGALTSDGRAILADDMHLGLRAPNLWFRARLRYPHAQAQAGRVDVSGFTLPGLPAVVVGSNGHVAWGFTNAYIDTVDWLAVPKSSPDVRRFEEEIRIAGQVSERFVVREVAWGPVMHEEGEALLALRWTAHQPGALNLEMADLARAADVEDAFAIADRIGMPTQNLMVADSHGAIGWRLVGTRPARAAGTCNAREVARPPCAAWTNTTSGAPHLLRPPSQRLWTANNRVLDAEALDEAGDAGYALGARARQIRDRLFAREHFAESDLLAIQLDDRALFLERWWRLLQAEAKHGPALRELAHASRRWEGRAIPQSTSYRLVRAWRLAVHSRIAHGLTAPAQSALESGFAMPAVPQLEGVVWPMLEQRPAHLLPAHFESWDALLESAASEVIKTHGGPGAALAERNWGEENKAHICHPMAAGLPRMFKRMLCMPEDALAGDAAMPRVSAPRFGASQRMVVAPGHEADGLVHMPGGQSGHPLSPFWGAGHPAWVTGQPTPFLPGETEHRLRLSP